MKNNASLAYAVLLIVGDFLALLAAFSFAYVLRVKLDPRPLIEHIPAISYLYAFAAVLPLWILVHAFIGLYNQNIYEKRFTELGHIFVGSFIGILVVIGYDFVTNGKLFPARLVPVYGLGLGFGFLVMFRTFARLIRQSLYNYGVGINDVLIIGDTLIAQEIATNLSDTAKTGQRVVGLVGAKNTKFKMFDTFEDASRLLKGSFNSIIQTELYRDQEKNNAILRYAQENHIAYRFVPGNTDLFVGNITVELFSGLPMISVHQTALTGWGRIAKRLFDLSAGFALTLVALPIMLVVAVMIKLLDPKGSIMFKQTRLTRFNREFTVYKFRTIKRKYSGMSPEQAFRSMGRPELAEKYRQNGDYLAKDPRVTHIGKFLRRTSLDELPQLLNVLRGELSLVGPRALVPTELNKYVKKHAILSVKSGLTGLAQISGRRDISFDERRTLDVYYVQNWSFWGDIVILLKTLRAVLGGIGAK